MMPLTLEESDARARADNIKTFGDPELITEEVNAWVREKADQIRASVKEGEKLKACYRRMIEDMRVEAVQRFPGCSGWACYFIRTTLGIDDMLDDEPQQHALEALGFPARIQVDEEDLPIVQEWAQGVARQVEASKLPGEFFMDAVDSMKDSLQEQGHAKVPRCSWPILRFFLFVYAPPGVLSELENRSRGTP